MWPWPHYRLISSSFSIAISIHCYHAFAVSFSLALSHSHLEKGSKLFGKQDKHNMQEDLQEWGAQGWRWVSCHYSALSHCPSQSHRSWLGKSDKRYKFRIIKMHQHFLQIWYHLCGISTVGPEISTVTYHYQGSYHHLHYYISFPFN